jgi:hypothetical protein
VVIYNGRVVAEMPAGEADEPALMRAAHGLPMSEAGPRVAAAAATTGASA